MVQVERELRPSHQGRSRLDIIADILRVAVGGVRKTPIMYRCNLSFKQLQAYLNLLLDRGLLRVISEKGSGTKFFEATDKGEAFLQAYRNLRALLAT